MYPPQLTAQTTVVDDQQQQQQQSSPIPNEGSNSPVSQPSSSPKQESPTAQKTDGMPQQPAKPQATFLTKLYALLERPENHHMIRWDQAGEHIIVERPEQLALHVLPSVYRQSRFASFSRQLNIYGFMRKVNLRNVDPAIDDPDASTWSHPTLNRHSPPEVVANFKRRVPPRLPKPRKRDVNTDVPTIPPPRSAIGMGHLPIGASSGPGSPGRRRGLSAPGSFTPLTQPGAAGWTTNYRTALPPLTVPDSHPSSLSGHPHNGMYAHSHPLTPADEPPSSSYASMSSYPNATSASNGRDMILPSPSSYSYQAQDPHWSYSSSGPPSASSGSLSSLLNPHTSSTTSSYASTRPTPHINTYSSAYSLPTISRPAHQGGASPESRPTTGYSASSLSSLPTPFDETAPHSFEYSRPGSSHRPLTPGSSRPTSSKASYNGQTLSVRRDRRHSHAMSPYPIHYSEHPSSERPSTSPHPGENHADAGGLPRVRSMQTMNMSGVNESYGYNPAQADFAFGAVDDHHHSGPGVSGGGGGGVYGRSVRQSASASSLSGSSSAANTPGAEGGYGGQGGHGDNVDINRCE
ncbi:HSF-type DNA-binding-domain-containing protein [Irpex rosettiformis]|uniref:HSF-type DNA-binding-domain-containing protein n=1 Tax=Irpex rosettiformis TaxID=378272 RepID=A0ACB8UFF3_9APHY|nr:HSF-type DNA-binding-domain-containing protein [Irpex rosettiformis]